ncbi:MAG: 3-deoxy-manno-octulosonate cytidylyltransferase [Bacteroidia bacterium]|nr:3-deoxy-manno-octulosonate cytidylyltransferase [Bacteroidia bacterium]MDW8302780.1 3-deoxy-manno-octulosonate cytidylyltransferase [Bacteroidia bacterium]
MASNLVLGVIPARYGSTRFEGKPLIDIAGKTMIQRVYEQVQKANLDKIIVATDDTRIYKHVQNWQGNVIMTDKKHPSGTDRCAEVAALYPEYNFILNIQGDEPLIHPDTINSLIHTLNNPDCHIATAYTDFKDMESLLSSNTAKVVMDVRGKVLYFSRSVIPYIRNLPQNEWLKQYPYKKHVGIYGFRRNILLEIAQISPSSLEQAESLEQLRWLEQGYQMYAFYTPHDAIGVDTPADVDKIIKKLC